MNGRRLASRLLALALVVAALLFLGRTLARNADALRDFDWNLNPALLVASIVALVLVLAWGVVIWHRILLLTTHQRIGLLALQRISFTSSIARYIPGKIWQFVAATQMAARLGLSGAAVVTSMAIQVGFTLLAAVLMAAATISIPPTWPIGRAALVILCAIGAVLLSHPLVIRGALALLPRTLHRDVLAWTGSWADGLALLALSLISWLVYGGAFWLFVSSLMDTPVRLVLPLAGVNALSFVIGYLVFVAPAGLGAREFAMTGLLGSLIPTYVAAAVSILFRIWTITAELLGAAIFSVAGRGTGSPPDSVHTPR